MGLLYGVGIKDVDYNVYKTGSVDGKRKVLWHCPFYKTWSRMLERCQSEKLHVKYPTYRGCSFISNWVYLSNFKAWMETQDWEGKQLDKDLLVPGNKLYSPETCVFVDQRVNTFITESTSARGKFMIGVSYEKSSNRFVAQCWSVVERKNIRIGRYRTEQEAHQAWLSFKLEQAHILASQQTDSRIAEALVKRYENYTP